MEWGKDITASTKKGLEKLSAIIVNLFIILLKVVFAIIAVALVLAFLWAIAAFFICLSLGLR